MNIPNDPHLDRLIQNQLKNGQPQQQLAAGQVWAVCGHCPKCGAPIWFCAAAPAQEQPPQAAYTCPCAMLESEKAKADLDAFQKRRSVLRAVNGPDTVPE